MIEWNGERLRQARLRSGMTQDELARRARTSVTNISRWERTRNRPSAAMVLTLALELGVDSASLFESDEEAEETDAEADSLSLDEFLGRRIDALLRQRLAALDTG